MCKSYAQVVQMIQKSGPNLQLVVMPKEHDVLQQVCYSLKKKLNQLNQLLILLGFLLSVLPIRHTILTRMQGRRQLFHPLAVKTRRAK